MSTNPPVTLTPKAVEIAHRLMEMPQYQKQRLRVYLCGKDCDGFLYGVNFDESIEGDYSWEQEGVPLLIDSGTTEVCTGATIDFVQDERGTGFLVQNPNQAKFEGKFWKKEKAKRRECDCGRSATAPYCDGAHARA